MAQLLLKGRGRLPESRRLFARLGDDRLVEQIRAGSQSAFEVVFDRHHGALLSFCWRMLGSRHDAEDAVQRTFVSAHQDLVASDKPIELRPWLYRIARNRCLSMIRARREPTVEVGDIPAVGTEEQVETRYEARELLADVGRLPDDQRAAVLLAHVRQLAHSDVAEIIGVEPAKVRALIFQARTKLAAEREARDMPCRAVREEIATSPTARLPRGAIRRHVRSCPGCSSFAERMRSQRRGLAGLLLPVPASPALRESVLAQAAAAQAAPAGGAAAGLSAGGAGVAGTGAKAGAIAGGSAVAGAGAGGGLAATGGLATGGFLGGALATGTAKAAVGVAVAATVAGGGFVARSLTDGDRDRGRSSEAGGGRPGVTPRSRTENRSKAAAAKRSPAARSNRRTSRAGRRAPDRRAAGGNRPDKSGSGGTERGGQQAPGGGGREPGLPIAPTLPGVPDLPPPPQTPAPADTPKLPKEPSGGL